MKSSKFRSDFKTVKWFYAKSEILKSTKCLHWLECLLHSRPIWLQLIIVTARPRTLNARFLYVPKVTVLNKDSCLPIKRRLIMQHFVQSNWMEAFAACSTSKLAKDHIFPYQNERFSFKLYLPLSTKESNKFQIETGFWLNEWYLSKMS